MASLKSLESRQKAECVPKRGLEPPHLAVIVPKTIVYTISPLGLTNESILTELRFESNILAKRDTLISSLLQDFFINILIYLRKKLTLPAYGW